MVELRIEPKSPESQLPCLHNPLGQIQLFLGWQKIEERGGEEALVWYKGIEKWELSLVQSRETQITWALSASRGLPGAGSSCVGCLYSSWPAGVPVLDPG